MKRVAAAENFKEKKMIVVLFISRNSLHRKIPLPLYLAFFKKKKDYFYYALL
jgi:hypothetical protein